MFTINFVNVGRRKATFSVDARSVDYLSLYRAVRGHLASSCIDFEVDDEKCVGTVIAGFYTVGAFSWAPKAEEKP